MPVFSRDNRSFLFAHVPKTGGTSLEVVFARSGFAVACIDFGVQGTLNHLRHCPPQHMHAEALQCEFVMDAFDGIFMVVRNPYDRFRSEYCMANPVRCDLSADAVEDWARRAFSEYERNSYARDNHLRPQSEFLLPGAAVYRFEQGFTNITLELSRRYGIALIRDDVREYARSRHNSISSADVELNQSVIRMINRQYARDFEQFGYEVTG